MNRKKIFLLLLGLMVLNLPPIQSEEKQQNNDFFETRVRPLLAEKCYACHTASEMGGLRLDSRERLMRGGKSGPAVVPGNARESLLVQAITGKHERLKMPPTEPLKDNEISIFVEWVQTGAVWAESSPQQALLSSHPQGKGYSITSAQRAFWAFQPVQVVTVPKVKNATWCRSPIDAFVLSKLEAEHLSPVSEADKRTLIRRASFDLIGLPPTPDDVKTFLSDGSPQAFEKVVDQLLASPRYGERWGRYWLDIARYSDDQLNSTQDEPYPNAFRYRNWVIQAFNEDLPYDLFVKAQIAGDLLQTKDQAKLIPGLGFYALSPEFQDDRVDVTTRGFLGLTVACAQCHDHKFDPIPTTDYYALLGIFNNTKLAEFPLDPPEIVKRYQDEKKKIDDLEKTIKEFLDSQRLQLSEILAAKSSHYMLASRRVMGSPSRTPAAVAREEGLDEEALERWIKYLSSASREHPYLKEWDRLSKLNPMPQEMQTAAVQFQNQLQGVLQQKKEIDQKNLITTGGEKDVAKLRVLNLLSLDRDHYGLWRDFFGEGNKEGSFRYDPGVLRFSGTSIDRFLKGEWKSYLELLRSQLDILKKQLPPAYAYVHTIKDVDNPVNEHVHIRGNKDNLGDEVPRRFLTILCNGEQTPFTKGSGRLQLAEAIASPENPLTARVMVNRIWQYHFGEGLVRTASNFGQLGERPSHPELLDYLTSSFIANGWSMKALHREIILSSTYRLRSEASEKNDAVDPGNRLLWRANQRRLDVEALRDSILYVAGKLDLSPGDTPLKLTDQNNTRRTIYGFVSRRRLDGTLALFDFPNPNASSEGRVGTDTPLQRLFFLNSDFILNQSKSLAQRIQKEGGGSAQEFVQKAYELLFQRSPVDEELRLGKEFLNSGSNAPSYYAQVLLSTNEFLLRN
ncbi:MAG: DUF1553 domain-containing protein [Terriglobia bacterium]